MKVLVCVLAVLAIAQCMLVKQVRLCTDEKSSAEFISASIEPCTAEPCALNKGSTASITLKLKPTTDITQLTTQVKGKIRGWWVPFPMSSDLTNACKSSVSCPIKAGQEVTYNFKLAISRWYPSLGLVVKWRLVDQDSKAQICLLFPMSLK